MPIKAPEINNKIRFFLISLKEIFDFFIRVTSKRKATPTKPLTQAITLEGRGMYLTKIPMVPKMVMAKINFPLARATESVFLFVFMYVYQLSKLSWESPLKSILT